MRYTIVLAATLVVEFSFALSSQSARKCCSSRRQALFGLGGCFGWALIPEDSKASVNAFNTNLISAKGAAELDLEFYIRDLVGGNAKEGNVERSAAPPMPPPRTLQEPLLSLLLDDDVTNSCIPRQALDELVSDKNKDVSQLTQTLREKVAPSFQKRAPWMTDHVRDQYYFDLTSYCLWRIAAALIPDFKTRDLFARNVGRKLYQQLREKKVIKNAAKTQSLADTSSAILEILNLFQTSNFCSSYHVVGNDGTTLASSSDAKTKDSVIFDGVDSDDLLSGSTINFLVSVIEPATLGASLQITGEQSRFSPEFVGSTLSAMFEESGISASYETYFVDQTYRPNPKDYFPNEQLLQFSLTKSQ